MLFDPCHFFSYMLVAIVTFVVLEQQTTTIRNAEFNGCAFVCGIFWPATFCFLLMFGMYYTADRLKYNLEIRSEKSRKIKKESHSTTF